MNKFMLCACGALLVGVTATAAEVSVTGNNTAVVIQKPVVKSATNYQFLCVPVRGFDISGNKEVEATKLSELLPVDVTPADTEVTIGNITYKLNKPDGWLNTESNEPADNTPLNHKTIFWVRTPDVKSLPETVASGFSLEQNSGEAPFVFCGEEETGVTEVVGSGVIAAGNAGSTPIIIKDEFVEGKYNFPAKDSNKVPRIYVIKSGEADFTIYSYTYTHGKYCWSRMPKYGEGIFNIPLENEAIAPGEAFYLQNLTTKKTVTP